MSSFLNEIITDEAVETLRDELQDEFAFGIPDDMLPEVRKSLTSAAAIVLANDLKRQADEYERQAGTFGTPPSDTPGAGVVTTLLDIARECRERAESLTS